MPVPAGQGCRGLEVAGSGVGESGPCPWIAAGFCEQAAGAVGALDATAGSGIMPGGGGGREPLVVRDTVQRSGVVAFLCG